MKKLLITLGIVFLILLAAAIITPLLFKGKIIQLVKDQANQNITATLDFDDVGLSLFKQFPRLTLTIDNLRLLNKAPFEGDTLTAIREFQATINLGSLFGNQPLEINSIYLDAPRIKLISLKDGRTNWDIAKEAPGAPQEDASAGLDLAVRQYELRQAYITYSDEASGQYLQLQRLNHRGKGDFQKSRFVLETQTEIENSALQINGVSYLNRAALNARVNLDMDLDNQKYTFKENEIRLNRLSLRADGWIAQVGENLEMDLKFDAPEADFKDILSMIPFIYRKDFADLKTEGKLSVSGAVQGIYSEKQVPSFNIALTVKNGMFQYPDLPTPVKQVQVDLQIQNPGKTADHTVINLNKLHFEILSDPVDAQAFIKTPVSDPYLKASLKGSINLGEVKNIFPMKEGVELSGKVRSDFQLSGNMSAIQKNRIEGYSVGGSLSFSEVLYQAPDLPEKVQVKSAELRFSPQKASLSNFHARLGKSDLRANGLLENIFGYVFHNQTIKGTVALQSDYFDLNPWMAGESEPLTAVELPAQVEFLMSANFKKVQFDNLNLSDVSGNMFLKDRVLNLIDISANLLGGSLKGSGTYSYIPPQKPKIFFDLNVSQFGIPETFKSFVTVRQFTPFAENLRGSFSANLNLNTDLDDKLMPVWQQFFSQGSLSIPKANLQDAAVFNQLADILKISQLRNPALNNLSPAYVIKEGRFHLNPVTFNIDKYQILASGSNGIDKTLDYAMKIHIPAEEAKKTANSYINQLIKKDLNLLTNETIVVDASIKGTYKDPKIQTSLADVVKGAVDPLTEAAKQEAEKQKAELERQAQIAIEKQKKELEAKKKEAEEKLKNKLKDLFKK